ncbi:DUF421 domain-containing protein [Litchfieldia salsa]|uniref:Uncharacterized membrane protein YcaP, DUF421 family n=1 Tax=Litchfieldia salsa TaxID=930152 RepID=A0A1H0S2L2_9BACI|nr:DUF421 domain-containing protein [Litchfieldia salsa]SDP35845.1 Uncharacterized membrane protein YcaP, DUF421 family [Litchfieldia salsa]
MEFVRIATDLIVGFVSLLIITKIMGKTQITQITPFDFISALILGELVGNAVYDKETGIFQIVFAVVLWGSLIFCIEIITQKFRRSRTFLEGTPKIVIHKGQIDRDALKKSKLDLNQLQHLLRGKGAFSMREVEYAILENDGSISVLKKAPYSQPTRKDLNIEGPLIKLPICLISDGEVIWENVKSIGYDENWLQDQMKTLDVGTYKEIIYAEWKEGEGFYAQKA